MRRARWANSGPTWAHYAAWRDAVAPMMAEARTSTKFTNVFPGDDAERHAPVGGAAMTAFEFATAGRIIFGEGSAASIPGWAAEFGSTVLVVTGSDPGRAESLVEGLQQRDAEVVLLSVGGEPDLPFVAGGAELARRRAIQVVIGIGGGSAIDAAKAIAALAANEGDPLDYLEGVGASKALGSAPLPLIAVPTTAGTGSEVTRNAVLKVRDRRIKASLRSPLMLPRLAVVDPLLTHDLPPSITATTDGFSIRGIEYGLARVRLISV